MPVWTIHTSPNLFSAEEKHQLAQKITPVYTAVGLPPFYVRIKFVETPSGTIFSGGEPHDKLVLFQVWHLARTFSNSDSKTRFLNGVDKVLNPVMEAKGVDWEYQFDESSRDLWKINGIIPPMPGTDAEQLWVKENRPVPYD